MKILLVKLNSLISLKTQTLTKIEQKEIFF